MNIQEALKDVGRLVLRGVPIDEAVNVAAKGHNMSFGYIKNYLPSCEVEVPSETTDKIRLKINDNTTIRERDFFTTEVFRINKRYFIKSSHLG